MALAPDPRDLCHDCRVAVYEIFEWAYMVKLPVWNEAQGQGLLCVGCLEKRLGRRLVADDFSNAPNNQSGVPHSERLMDRLRVKTFLPDSEMPRALAIDNYLGELGIGFDQVSQSTVHRFALRVTFTRGDRTCSMVIPTGWSSRANAIDIIDAMRNLHRFDGAGFSAGLMRNIRRDAGRAEILLRTLFSQAERAQLRELLAVSTIE